MKFLKQLLSMPVMAILLLIFAFAIGWATFVEDIHGTIAAKAVIYNAKWFEALLLWLSISMVFNMFKYRLFSFQKLPVFLFHISFLVIIAAAALTRYVGVDGMLHVREGNMTKYISTTDNFFKVNFENEEQYAHYDELVRLTHLSPTNLNTKVRFDEKDYRFKSKEILFNAKPVFESIEQGEAMIDVMISGFNAQRNIVLKKGEAINLNGVRIGFEALSEVDLQIFSKETQLFINGNQDIIQNNMMAGKIDTLNGFEPHPFQLMQLYVFDELSLVTRAYYPSAQLSYEKDQEARTNLETILSVEVSKDDFTTISYFPFSEKSGSFEKTIAVASDLLSISFGPKYIELPFYIQLENFNITRYPGSSSPSSFDSYVNVINEEKEKVLDYHIYMNHVLHYEGWRFFQSSYDEDELGSIFSVTHDEWGILITYLGYILLTISMLLTLFWKGTSFRFILSKIYKTKPALGLLLILTLSPFISNAQADNKQIVSANESTDVTEEIALTFTAEQEALLDDFSRIWLLDRGGRLKPLNTLFHELARKVAGKSKIEGLPAHIAIADMMIHPADWMDKKVIKVDNEEIMDLLSLEGKYICLNDIMDRNDESFNYLLKTTVEEAYRTPASDRKKFDNEIINLDERLNIMMMIQSKEFLTIFPDPGQPSNSWYSPVSRLQGLETMDSLFMKSAVPLIFNAIRNNQQDDAQMLIKGIKDYQNKFAAEILPSIERNQLEVIYERVNLFSRLALVYVLFAVIILVFILFSMLTEARIWTTILNALKGLLWIFFILQATAMGIRWYITGHAPFSNGYEAMLYVSLTGLLLGLILSNRNQLLLFVTAIFAASPLFVAHLNLMSPELTNLVPVLKSYWLTIHVATITTSYAVFGFIAFVSLLNMILMAYSNPKTNRFNAIIDEFTDLNQILLTIGLFLITIGCFLGGVWANESWGTYWSWDPKETWCLVSILVYSFVAHIKHIEGMRSRYAFNLAAFLSFSTILMTYFGVNYFLGGMHSYGKGDAFSLSTGAWIITALIVVTLIIAPIMEKKK